MFGTTERSYQTRVSHSRGEVVFKVNTRARIMQCLPCPGKTTTNDSCIQKETYSSFKDDTAKTSVPPPHKSLIGAENTYLRILRNNARSADIDLNL